MEIINNGVTCPLSEYLVQAFHKEIRDISERQLVGDNMALCTYLCPALLGYFEDTENEQCAIRKRLLNEDKLADLAIADIPSLTDKVDEIRKNWLK